MLGFSVSQPYEVTLVGEPGETGTQTLTNIPHAAYLPNKVVIAGCAPDGGGDAELTLLQN